MRNLNEGVRGGTRCNSKAGLVMYSSDKNDVEIAAPNGAGVDYQIKGKAYFKADATGIVVSAAQQAADTTCLYFFVLNAAGDLSAIKAEEVATDDLTNDLVSLPWPVVDTGTYCPISMCRIVTDSVTFDMGTDDFDKSGVTATFTDLCEIPAANEV